MIAEADAAADSLFGPVAVEPIEIKPAQAHAYLGVEQVRFGEIEHVALDQGAWRRFEPKVLARSAKGLAAAKVLPTARHAPPVEVLFAQHDVADESRIRVHAGSEHELASLGLAGGDRNRKIPDSRVVQVVAAGLLAAQKTGWPR